jgi:hypothetical protein
VLACAVLCLAATTTVEAAKTKRRAKVTRIAAWSPPSAASLRI